MILRPNEQLRDKIKRAGLTNYAVAERIGISTSVFYSRLQRRLSPEREAEILTAINELSAERSEQL